MRLIDADALIDEIGIIKRIREEKGFEKCLFSDEKITEMISGMHTKHPQKHAHWVFGNTLGHSWMKCSECLVSQDGQTSTWTYCPNCGAVMDEKAEDYNPPGRDAV